MRKELYEDIVKVDFDRLALLKQKKVSKTLTSEQALELKKLERKYKEYRRNKRRKELQREMEQKKK